MVVLARRENYNLPMEELDKKYMRLALEQALFSKEQGDRPFGAAVVQGDQVLIVSCNSEHKDQDVTAHAETKAVSEACRLLGTRDLSGCTLYSTVEPCTMCSGAIFYSCLSRVVYAISRDDLRHLFKSRSIRIAELAHDGHYGVNIVQGVLRQEAMELFDSYEEPFRVVPDGLRAAPVFPSL